MRHIGNDFEQRTVQWIEENGLRPCWETPEPPGIIDQDELRARDIPQSSIDAIPERGSHASSADGSEWPPAPINLRLVVQVSRYPTIKEVAEQ